MKITNFLIPVIPTIHPNWLETLSLVLLGILSISIVIITYF